MTELLDGDDDSDWDDAEEMEQDGFSVLCLFCKSTFPSPESVYGHCREEHNLNIDTLVKKFNLETLDYIRMTNFIRLNNIPPDFFETLSPGNGVPWMDDRYLKPVLEDDLLLTFDVESILEAPDVGEGDPSRLHSRHIEDLNMQLQDAQETIAKMRAAALGLLNPGKASEPDHIASSVGALRLDEDRSYFESYSHYGIHHEMLQDTARTEAYQKALLSNSSLFADKVVLDVGCGTGVLSLFAAKVQAGKVIGVEQSEIIYSAMDVIRENGLTDKISLVKGRLEDVQLPVDKVDVIISEWMGYFLLFEGMLDTVVYARDHYLKESGLILPNRCHMYLVAMSDEDLHSKYIGCWDDVYGFKMTCLKKEVLKEALVETIKPDSICSKPFVIKELDLLKCTSNECTFSKEFSLDIEKTGSVTAFGSYFDCFFDLPEKVCLSTSPSAPPTHWKQTVFLLDKAIVVQAGDTLQGRISCQRDIKNPRSLSVTLTLGDRNWRYYMS